MSDANMSDAPPHQQPQLNLGKWASLPRPWDESARFITDHCVSLLQLYLPLLAQTTLPANILSTDQRVMNAFRVLHETIIRENNSILARLAYIQLDKVFTAVETSIATERKMRTYGRFHNTTIAIARCMEAINTDKTHVMELRRRMKRWGYLAKPSIFFLMIYSESAESIIKNFKTTSDTFLPQLVKKIEVATPESILSACGVLDLAVYKATIHGDSNVAASIQGKVRHELEALLPSPEM
ncbi:hypothetical protein F5Y17DRAFT_453259 [Xylariaceae sp. FL0594]|nr:hypothetical protein F5Y17DRAFT_453259 [Xylariaceae sp. FL0594]